MMTAPSPVETVLARLDAVKRTGTGWIACCPAHRDGRLSLKIDVGDDGRALLHCYAGCEPAAIVAAIGLEMSDLFVRDEPPRGPSTTYASGERITYDYHDATGELRFQVVRNPGKRFSQRRPDGRGGWITNLDGVERCLYHEDELAAEPDRWVGFCEGEKDSDRLRGLGLLATTVAGGSNAPWTDSYSETLRDRAVTIFADNDPPGFACAHTRAQALQGIARRVKVIELSDLPAKGDVSDWIDAGHTKDELLRILKDAPEWTPESMATDLAGDDAATPEPAAFRLQTRRASTIEPRDIDWLWKPWLPAGMVGLFAGYGGSGKSTVALSIAAACSHAGILPDGQRAPLSNTLVFAAEDSPEHTIVPRLIALGADLERIHIVEGIARDGDDPGWVTLRNNVPHIEQNVREHEIGLVIVDPVSSFIGDANGDKESDVRAGIMPIVAMADRTGCAVLLIRHVSKAGDGVRAASRILGSTAWHDIPRVAWMLADAPDDHQPEPHEDGTRDTRRVLGVVKSNLAAKPQARMCIQPVDGPLRWQSDPSPVTIDACFFSQSDRGAKTRNAEDWARTYLIGGSRESARLFADARTEGLAEKTVRAALKRLGAESFQLPGKAHGGWFWRLPHGDQGAHSPDGQVTKAPSDDALLQTSLSHESQVTKRPENQGKPNMTAESAGSPEAGHLVTFPIPREWPSDQVTPSPRAMDDLDPDDRADVEEIVTELRQGGVPAIEAWRTDLENNHDLTNGERVLAMLAIQIAQKAREVA